MGTCIRTSAGSRTLLLGVLALPALLTSSPAAAQAPPASQSVFLQKPGGETKAARADWQSLFDGKTLSGWQPSERPESWKIEDGAIVTSPSRRAARRRSIPPA